MRLLPGLAVTAVLALSACSGESADPAAQPSEGPQATAPSEALAPVPSVRPRTDARILLGPEGDLELLPGVVENDIERLSSVHIEHSGPHASYSYDAEDGRCSGEGEEEDVRFRFVTTDDGHLLAALEAGTDQWVDIGTHPIAEACVHDPGSAVLAAMPGVPWGFPEPTRIGVERVAGQRAVHFRKTLDWGTIDSWIAADGEMTRVLKVVTNDKGNVFTVELSAFDSAGPVAPVPATSA